MSECEQLWRAASENTLYKSGLQNKSYLYFLNNLIIHSLKNYQIFFGSY